MSSQAAALVLVGRRNAARRAARAAGFKFDNRDPTEALAGVDALRQKLAPAAVVAVTEASVLPAARLRAALSLPGNPVATAQRCSDKLLMKQAVSQAGVRCANFLPVDGPVDAQALVAALGLPLVLKARVGSGGRGARVVHSTDQLPARVDTPHIAESFVRGVEMSVESLVVDGAPVFVNLTEYVEPQWANLVPAVQDTLPRDALLDLNRRAITALGIVRGMTHMEVFLTANGPAFGELGARPPGGHLMRLIELAYGFDPWAALLAIELGLPPTIAGTPRQSAGVRFIHPGPGIVRAVHGFDALESLSALHEFHCTLTSGARIEARDGTGQHHGYALLAGSADDVRHGLDMVRDRLRVDMEDAPAR